MTTRTALVCLVIAVAYGAESKPDFSGKWKLNIDESEFPGTKPSPATFSAVRTVEQKRNELRLKVERVNNADRQSERTEDWTLSADGKKLIDHEWVKRPDGQELRYTVVFDRQP